MKTGSSADVFFKDVKPGSGVTEKTVRWSLRFFKHGNLLDALENARTIKQTDLSNLLNSIHFSGKSVDVLLHHPEYKENILASAYPEPNYGKTLTCRWAEEHLPGSELEKCDLSNLFINDGQSVVIVPVSPDHFSLESFSFPLPETAHILNRRKRKRYLCQDVAVELLQRDKRIMGEMIDFHQNGFRILVGPDIDGFSNRFKPDTSITILIRQEKTVIFSCSCFCIRSEEVLSGTDVVLIREQKRRRRSPKKQIRDPRKQLVPSPSLTFEHPFSKKNIRLDIADLSTSGFCVHEEADDAYLVTDMVIREMVVDFRGGMKLKCAVKVSYCSEEEEGIRCGLSILDMGIADYSCLTHILSKAIEPHAHTCSSVNMEDLWEFFFSTGFIYSQKYRSIHAHREKFKETYRKLYQEDQDIAMHFTYQKNNRIFGHMAMVRAYEKSWMIHHHAAMPVFDKRAGFMVLKQIMHCINNMYRFPSANMEYVMCYFRPESKFPDHVFGGFSREINDPKRCSMDLFSYFIYPTLSLRVELPGGWSIGPCSKKDLWELNRFYLRRSGGLLLDIIYPKHDTRPEESVEDLYNRYGLTRKWNSYALIYYDQVKAVLIVEQADLGLNLSGLLNSIKILVIDEKNLPWDVLSAAVHRLTDVYQTEKVPILIYPHDYLEIQNASYETKRYMLWIYDARFVPRFMQYMEENFKISYWK